MKKVNLNEINIEDNFTELTEKCLMAVDGGCGGSGFGVGPYTWWWQKDLLRGW